MTAKRCNLIIPGDKQSIKLVSLDGKETYFSAGELQAERIAGYVGIVVGGSHYAFYEGELAQLDDTLTFTMSGFDTDIEIIFGSSSVRSVKITWTDQTQNA